MIRVPPVLTASSLLCKCRDLDVLATAQRLAEPQAFKRTLHACRLAIYECLASNLHTHTAKSACFSPAKSSAMALKRSRTTESSQPPYTPLYVTPLIFLSSPTPPTSRTATYTLTRPPGCLLAVGTAVCLCLAQAQCLEIRGSSRVAQTAAGSPAIWGWIAGERSRTVDEVEYVVKNEDRNAPILRAFVRFRSLPGLIPLPRLGDLVAERFQRSVGEGVAGQRESWDAGPTPPWISSQQQHATQTDRATDRRERCDGDGPYGSAAEAMPAVEDLRYLKNPLQTRVMATQPYSIWEPYVESATTWPTQAVVDGIRNYGQPIVVSSREQEMEAQPGPGREWRYIDSVGGVQEYDMVPDGGRSGRSLE